MPAQLDCKVLPAGLNLKKDQPSRPVSEQRAGDAEEAQTDTKNAEKDNAAQLVWSIIELLLTRVWWQSNPPKFEAFFRRVAKLTQEYSEMYAQGVVGLICTSLH